MQLRKLLIAAVIPAGMLLQGCETIEGLFVNPLEIDVACETATSALVVATVFKAQGKLSVSQIASINDAVLVVDPICGADTRPSSEIALDLVKSAVLTLTGVNQTISQ